MGRALAILIACALVVLGGVWLYQAVRSPQQSTVTTQPATLPAGTGDADDPATAPVPPRFFRTPDQVFETYFAAAAPSGQKAAPIDPATLEGRWSATLVQTRIDTPGDSVTVNPRSGFEFAIARGEQGWTWTASVASARPRALTVVDNVLIARSDEDPDIQLSMEKDALVCRMQLQSPATVVVEFHAKRIP